MKPITWIPLIWNIVCGAALSGGEGIVWILENVLKIAACMLLSGLLMADYTQTTTVKSMLLMNPIVLFRQEQFLFLN
jgi:hypothetical protein